MNRLTGSHMVAHKAQSRALVSNHVVNGISFPAKTIVTSQYAGKLRKKVNRGT